VEVAYVYVSTFVLYVQSKFTLLRTSAMSTRRTTIFRGHSLMLITNVDDPEVDIIVLTTTIVGVLPGETSSVVMPATLFALLEVG
jgi:hypothetical protein